jgi:transporter family protein
MVIGIVIVMGAYVALSKEPKPLLTPASTLVGISTGALWALGMLFSVLAIGMGANVSRITPIYNCNTLVAVLLGIMILKEIPDSAGVVRIIIGSLLIISGGVLVAK